jgi:hypothetical protein
MAARAQRLGGVYVTKITIDPPRPRVGEEFRVTVTLSGPVPAPLRLGWEKQRLQVIATSGFAPELRPTGQNYFEWQGEPITIPTDKDRGEARFIIREDAVDADDRPVVFPDNLVLTYFTESGLSHADAYRTRIVKILQPVRAARRRRK